MLDFLSNIPTWLNILIVGVPLVLTGIFATIGITDEKARKRAVERQAESDKLQESIRALYKEESTVQNEKIQAQNIVITDLTKRIASVEGENTVMKAILQGTDPKSLEYRNRVETSLALVDKLAEVILQNGTKADKILTECLTIHKSIALLAKAIVKK